MSGTAGGLLYHVYPVIMSGILKLGADGHVGGIQMTLSHGADFSIEMADAYIAEYATRGNETTLLIIEPGTDLFTTSGEYEIVEVIVANANGLIDVTTGVLPGEFSLSNAYPNPFNPVTTMQLTMPADGYAEVNVYNLVGQVVATLVNGQVSAGQTEINWNAENLPSGMYLIQAEVGASVQTQKVMLLK